MGHNNMFTGCMGGDFLVLLFKLSDDALDAHGHGRRRAAANLGVASVWSCMAALEVWRHCATTTRVVVFVINFRKHRTLGISNIRLITCRQMMSVGPLHL